MKSDYNHIMILAFYPSREVTVPKKYKNMCCLSVDTYCGIHFTCKHTFPFTYVAEFSFA